MCVTLPLEIALSNKPFLAKLANSKYNKEDDLAAMIKGFEWATKRRFKNAADKSYIKFGRISDNDKSFGISSGQMSLTGYI